MHESVWIGSKNRAENGDDEDDDNDDDVENEGRDSSAAAAAANAGHHHQKTILTQKPLGLLAQHGLSGRGGGGGPATKFRSSDDEGQRAAEKEEEEEKEKEKGKERGNRGERERKRSNSCDRFFSNETEVMRRKRDDVESDVTKTGSSFQVENNFASHISLMDQRFIPSPALSVSPGGGSGNGPSTPGHHWTFEEQFKQLYELSDDVTRKVFLDDLFSFMQKRGTPVNRIPIMAKQTLDLFELFQLVVSKGGLVEVINKKLWREITKGLNLPSSITSAAFTLRTQYMKYLYPYECEKLKLSTLSELQYAVDGNRREGRRSGFAPDFPLPPMIPLNSTVPHMHDGPMNTGTITSGRTIKDRDHQLMLAPSVNQLRTLAECDAHAVKAMDEVTKRIEVASRVAAAAAGVTGGFHMHAAGQGCMSNTSTTINSSSNPCLKTDESPLERGGGGRRGGSLEEMRFTVPPQINHHSHSSSSSSSSFSTAHIRLTSRENGHHTSHMGNSIIGSMEINGILYQGVLFAQH